MNIHLKAMAVTALVAWASLTQAVELAFWSWRVEDKAFYENVAREYKKLSGDDVKFQAYKNTEYPTVLSAALASGGGPDIIHTRAYGGLSNLTDADYLMALDKKSVPNLGNFSSASLDGARGHKPPYNDSFYGVPFATQALGILYNKALLAKVGVTQTPSTWGEFLALCTKLKAMGISPLANGVKDAALLEQMFGVVGPNYYGGSEFYRAVIAGQKKFTDPAFVKAIDAVVALRKFMPPNALGIGENESRTVFAIGAAAFFITGSWNIATIRQLNPKLDFGIAAAPPLTAGGPTWVSTFADGNYSVNAKTRNREAALRFVNYLASKEYGQAFTQSLGQISAVSGTVSSDPLLESISQQARDHGTPFLMLVGFRFQNPNGSVLLRDGIQKLMQGSGSSTELASHVQSGLASWHKPFQH